MWGGVKNYRFFDIFLDILHKLKGNMGQEHVKKSLYPSGAKIGTIFPAIPGKMTVFNFCPYFSTVPSYSLASPPKQELYF